MRGGLKRKWPDHLGGRHLRGQSCEDVSADSDLDHLPNASRYPSLGLLEVFALTALRSSSSPLEGQRTPPSPLPDQRDFCDRLWCGVRQGSQALPSRAIICRWYCRPCEGLRPNWPDYLWAGHLRGQSSEDVSGESGLTTSAQGSELRGCLGRKWPEHMSSGHLGTQSCEDVARETGRTTMG